MKQSTHWEQAAGGNSAGLWLAVALFLLSPGVACPQGDVRHEVAVEENVLADEAAPAHTADTVTPADETTRKRRALAGLAAVGGIAILGVAIIAATMVWARRLRRLARNMGPPQKTIGNDFWFLKPPKPVANDSPIANKHRPPREEKRDEPE